MKQSTVLIKIITCISMILFITACGDQSFPIDVKTIDKIDVSLGETVDLPKKVTDALYKAVKVKEKDRGNYSVGLYVSIERDSGKETNAETKGLKITGIQEGESILIVSLYKKASNNKNKNSTPAQQVAKSSIKLIVK